MPAPAQHFFKYEPLTDPNQDIRLLKISPGLGGPDGNLIQGELAHVRLSEAPPFFALSYVWGEPGDIDGILVNGVPFAVQRNLHDFLQKVHMHKCQHGSVLIWADAICIKQTEDAGNYEKNHQV
jgi:hypothetical protein